MFIFIYYFSEIYATRKCQHDSASGSPAPERWKGAAGGHVAKSPASLSHGNVDQMNSASRSKPWPHDHDLTLGNTHPSLGNPRRDTLLETSCRLARDCNREDTSLYPPTGRSIRHRTTDTSHIHWSVTFTWWIPLFPTGFKVHRFITWILDLVSLMNDGKYSPIKGAHSTEYDYGIYRYMYVQIHVYMFSLSSPNRTTCKLINGKIKEKERDKPQISIFCLPSSFCVSPATHPSPPCCSTNHKAQSFLDLLV